MNGLNPSLIICLVFGYSLGYVCNDYQGGMVGLTVVSGICLAVDVISNMKK